MHTCFCVLFQTYGDIRGLPITVNGDNSELDESIVDQFTGRDVESVVVCRWETRFFRGRRRRRRERRGRGREVVRVREHDAVSSVCPVSRDALSVCSYCDVPHLYYHCSWQCSFIARVNME